MPPPRRKKWTEAEERTLIDKYGEMIGNGNLAKMKTREKKYKPIALHVNSIHHVGDPIAYPWEWSWKDVSNKVQNMRHQYSLVKQKIKNGGDGFDWVEGLTHWSNFLRYKEVFGDVTVSHPFDESNHGLEFANIRQCYHENGVMGLEFDYDDGDANENENENGNDNGNGNFIEGYEEVHSTGLEKRKKRKTSEKKAWRFMASQLAQLREMESRFEQREEERERERERRERVMERLKEKRNEEWECRRREREEEVIQWEERSERRRSEWNARIDEMLSEHRAEMAQFQARILDEQQNLTSQLLGIVSQWSGHPTDNTNGGGGSSSHYLTQMMQHVGGMVDADAQVEGHNHNHNQDDEFIV